MIQGPGRVSLRHFLSWNPASWFLDLVLGVLGGIVDPGELLAMLPPYDVSRAI